MLEFSEGIDLIEFVLFGQVRSRHTSAHVCSRGCNTNPGTQGFDWLANFDNF